MRLRVYGYLLLDPSRAALRRNCINYIQRNDRLQDETAKSHDTISSSDSWTDLDSEDDALVLGGFNPYGFPMGDMCDGMFNEVYNGYGGYNGWGPLGFMGDISDPPSSISTDDESESDEEGSCDTNWFGKVQRHLAILRTNRQIYNEASALLHSDLAIDVEPGDVSILVPGDAIVEQNRDVWSRDPSKSLGSTNTDGQRVYGSGLLNGIVEPHVFAQFEKVSYHANFCFKFISIAPSLHINDNFSIRAKDEAKFVSYLTTAKGTTRWFEEPVSGRPFDNGRRETIEDVAGITISSVTVTEPSSAEIVQKFVDLLSNSPLIRHLEVILNVQVGHKDLEDLGWQSDYDLDSEEEAMDIEKAKVADKRATELFLECSVLDSLRKLSNVKAFSLKIATEGRGDKVMEPRQKHLKIIRDLKEVIEKNWVVKHGPR